MTAPATLSALDRWWVETWSRLANYRRRPPSLRELAAYASRGTSNVHLALTRLELAGVFVRDERRRFVLAGWTPPAPRSGGRA